MTLAKRSSLRSSSIRTLQIQISQSTRTNSHPKQRTQNVLKMGQHVLRKMCGKGLEDFIPAKDEFPNLQNLETVRIPAVHERHLLRVVSWLVETFFVFFLFGHNLNVSVRFYTLSQHSTVHRRIQITFREGTIFE